VSTSGAEDDVGATLISYGWRQGSLLPSVGYSWFEQDHTGRWRVRTVEPASDERLVVVSQECDIVSAREPFVEAMSCSWQPKGTTFYNAARLGNSGRAFLLRRRQEADGRDGADVVDATQRVEIAKASLLAVAPETGIGPDDVDRQRRFRSWLGGRYSRPALDERVVDSVQKPILKGVARLLRGGEWAEAIDLIRELRFFPLPKEPPYALDLIVLVDDEALRIDERIAGFLRQVELWLKESPVECRVARSRVVSSASLSVAVYEQTLRMPLDYITLGGETIRGGAPVEGVDHG
jgi:hypothetical protein